MKKVTTHHNNAKAKKSAIKTFVLDINHLTGIKNFTTISKNPLAIPADREFTMSGETQYSPKKEESNPQPKQTKKTGFEESKKKIDSHRQKEGDAMTDMFYKKVEGSEKQTVP